jgi:hypothetical protein
MIEGRKLVSKSLSISQVTSSREYPFHFIKSSFHAYFKNGVPSILVFPQVLPMVHLPTYEVLNNFGSTWLGLDTYLLNGSKFDKMYQNLVTMSFLKIFLSSHFLIM